MWEAIDILQKYFLSPYYQKYEYTLQIVSYSYNSIIYFNIFLTFHSEIQDQQIIFVLDSGKKLQF